MARDTDTRYTLSGTLVCRTPLHVGGFGDDPDTDLPLARDGRHRCYIPGTSLAGALRQWCRSAFGDDAVRAVWGFQKDDEGHASYITVDDIFVKEEQLLIPEVRDGVGIDRRTGAAAESIKYDRAVLPRGTKLTGFTLTADVKPEDGPLALAMLAGLKDALGAGRVRLGAAKTRGLGKVELDEKATLTWVKTNTRAGAVHLLHGTADEVPEVVIADARRTCPEHPQPRLEVVIGWKPDGPLMVKAGFDGIAVDMLPLVSGTDGGVAPVLPGSSIKGALRSRAEQIVRALLDIHVGTADNPRKRFLDDLNVPLVNELFGARGDPKAGAKLGLGALSVDDCYAKAALTPAAWQQIAAATDEEALQEALAASPAKDWQEAFHVAIDRWTGGAAESFLYTVLEPHAVEWEAIKLTIDLDRMPTAGVALLLLVLRDLATGRLPLGFAVNRGMGAVKEVVVTVTPHAAGDGFGTAPFALAAMPQKVREYLNREWAAWLDQTPAAEVTR